MRNCMQTSIQNTELLNRVEAAEYIRTSQRTLDQNLANGNIAVIHVGRRVLIRKAALDAFLEANESRVNPKRRAARK